MGNFPLGPQADLTANPILTPESGGPGRSGLPDSPGCQTLSSFDPSCVSPCFFSSSIFFRAEEEERFSSGESSTPAPCRPFPIELPRLGKSLFDMGHEELISSVSSLGNRGVRVERNSAQQEMKAFRKEMDTLRIGLEKAVQASERLLTRLEDCQGQAGARDTSLGGA
ncbi:hypothetical protein LIER_38245 [Lithospermum erythrorhizon]|uniref:Uncharacterized protein n=1 Tax=Lithospermum erythrorhizon TaxID=34254 RepID=A0AAV3Q1B3_LITER